jgi:hypothetical protein
MNNDDLMHTILLWSSNSARNNGDGVSEIGKKSVLCFLSNKDRPKEGPHSTLEP